MRGLGTIFWILVLATLAAPPHLAHAGLTHADYLQALGMVQAKTATKHQTEIASTQGPPVQDLLGRAYQVGESWDVAAFLEGSSMARKTNEAADLPHLLSADQRPGRAALFHYVVIAASPSEIRLRITQLARPGLPVADPRVDWVDLRLDGNLGPIEKKYKLAGIDKLVAVSAQGVHSRISRLELYPLDALELGTAERLPAQAPPKLPPSLQSFADPRMPAADFARLAAFRQDDFFGRPINALWRKGDPWPTYLSTISGVAILTNLSQEGAR